MATRGFTVVDAGQKPDPRTGGFPIVGRALAPARREQFPPGVPDDVAQVLHRMQAQMHEVRAQVSQTPEGGQRAYVKDVAFAVGTDTEIYHLIGVASDGPAATSPTSAPKDAFASNPSQVRFEVSNVRGVPGTCYLVNVDARRLTLRSTATFVADVHVYVVP